MARIFCDVQIDFEITWNIMTECLVGHVRRNPLLESCGRFPQWQIYDRRNTADGENTKLLTLQNKNSVTLFGLPHLFNLPTIYREKYCNFYDVYNDLSLRVIVTHLILKLIPTRWSLKEIVYLWTIFPISAVAEN